MIPIDVVMDLSRLGQSCRQRLSEFRKVTRAGAVVEAHNANYAGTPDSWGSRSVKQRRAHRVRARFVVRKCSTGHFSVVPKNRSPSLGIGAHGRISRRLSRSAQTFSKSRIGSPLCVNSRSSKAKTRPANSLNKASRIASRDWERSSH